MPPPIVLAVFLAVTGGFQEREGREPVMPPPASAPVTAEPQLAPTIRGLLLDEWGAPLAGWRIEAKESAFLFHREGGPGGTTASDGRFAFATELAHFALVARAPDGGIVALREAFRLDGRELLVRLRPEERPSGYLEGTLLGPGGAPLEQAYVEAESADELHCVEAVRSGDRFRIGPLVPGGHTLHASVGGGPELVVSALVSANATNDIGILRFEPPGRIHVRLAHPGIEFGASDVVYTQLLCDGLHWIGSVRNGPAAARTDGLCAYASLAPPGESGELAPGRYLLMTYDAHGFAPDVFVDVFSGRTTEVALTLVPAVRRAFLLRVPDWDPAVRLPVGVTANAGGFEWEDEEEFRSTNGFLHSVVGLVPGRYHLEARSPSGIAFGHEFEVVAGEPDPGTIELFPSSFPPGSIEQR
jgi:hypothetical protein